MALSRGFTPRFAMTIGGKTAGYVNSAKGGHMQAECSKLDPSSDNRQRKHIVGVKYTPFEIDIALGMSGDMCTWIQDTMDKRHSRQSGELVVADNDCCARQARVWHEALITEVTFPALSGDAKDTAFLKVKFDPEWVEYQSRGGEDIKGIMESSGKEFSGRNYSFLVDSMPTGRCTKVESFTFKQEIVENGYGEATHPEKLAGKPEIPDISAEFAINTDNINDWQAWAQDYIARGSSHESNNLTGAIEYRDSENSEAARVDLMGIGLQEMGFTEVKGGANASFKVTCKFFVEDAKFSLGKIK